MNRNHKLMNLQLFAPTNETTTSDLAPAISIDFTSRISENIRTLAEILGIVEMQPMAAGTTIKLYTETVDIAEQVGEGEVIGLSKVSRALGRTITLTLDKYRKQVTAEAIQSYGQDRAINRTDDKLISEIRKTVKTSSSSASMPVLAQLRVVLHSRQRLQPYGANFSISSMTRM